MGDMENSDVPQNKRRGFDSYKWPTLTVLKEDEQCGCFYCLKIFSPSEIKEWIEEEDPDNGKGGKAICPYCGVDSVIGDSSGIPVTLNFLSKMKKLWFV